MEENQVIEALKTFGVASSSLQCPACNNILNINRDKTKMNLLRYYCKECKKRYEASVFTPFKAIKIPLITILEVLDLFIAELEVEQAEEATRVNKKTILKIHEIAIVAIHDHIEATSPKLGSKGPVEIDETVIARRKYNRGRIVPQQWQFGGVEREGGRLFLKTVPKRDSKTLGNIIKDFIIEGSTIFSDKWGAYEKYFRDNQEFEHRSVNHSVEFVSSLDPVVHTQTIEGLWSHLKNFLRKRCLRRRKNIELYLSEFIFRKMNNYNNELVKFEKLIDILFSK